jgi:hypothetical protein
LKRLLCDAIDWLGANSEENIDVDFLETLTGDGNRYLTG